MSSQEPDQPVVGTVHAQQAVTAAQIGTVYVGGSPPPPVATENLALAGIVPNPGFVGRIRELNELHTALQAGDVNVTQSIRGEGGIGKAELAKAYVFAHRSDYEGVWWIDASKEGLNSSIQRLARKLHLAPEGQLPTADICGLLRDYWSDGRRHLIVLDNVESFDVIRLFGVADPCRVLVTTRFNLAVPGIQEFELHVLDMRDALALLLQRRSDFTDETHKVALQLLANEVGRHAQALALLSAYLGRFSDTPDELLIRLRAQNVGEDGHPFGEVPQDLAHPNYALSVEASLSLHWDRFQRSISLPLLRFASFCHPDGIPISLLAAVLEVDEHEAERSLNELADVSVLRRASDKVSMHRLTQSVLRSRVSLQDAQQSLESLASVLLAVFSEPENPEHFSLMTELEPHGLSVVEHGVSGGGSKGLGCLANQIGVFAWQTARLDLAVNCLKIAEQIDRTAYGDDHPHVGTCVNNIGSALQVSGDLEGALSHYREAERIARAAYGDCHQDVARNINNIGSVLHDQGDLDEALRCYEEAARIDRIVYGTNSPELAVEVNNIGSLLQSKGELDRALIHFLEAERIDRAAYGDDHPNRARDVNNIGTVLLDMDDADGALPHFKEAERVFRMALGNDHPQVATCVNNIGLVLQAKGDLQEARSRFEEAERIDRAAYGDRHSRIAIRANNIGGVLRDMGDLEGAKDRYQEAFLVLLRACGSIVPNVIAAAINLMEVGFNPLDLAKQEFGPEIAMQLSLALQKRLG